MKYRFKFLTILLAVVLSACVQVPQERPTSKKQVAISSVRDLPTQYPAGSTFALSPKYLKHVSFKAEQVKNIYNTYTSAIVSSLQSQGYVLADHNTPAQFYVGFGVALDDDLKDTKISDKFGISPGLQSVENMDKGSFLIFIEDADSSSMVWRGAVQGYVQEEFSEQERHNRANKIVHKLLLQFYTKL